MRNLINIEEAQLNILNEIEFLSEIITEESIPFGEKLKSAAILQELIGVCETALIPFKAKLRDMGKASGESNYKTLSDDGEVCAAVVTPKLAYRLSKTFTVSDAIKLPEFESLVEEKTTYKLKRGAAETILSMNGEGRDQWIGMIETKELPGRVKLNFIK